MLCIENSRRLRFWGACLALAAGVTVVCSRSSEATSFAHSWSRGFAGTSLDDGISVSATSDGGALITGYFSATADFGGGLPLTSAGGFDIFVLKLAADGSHVWSRRFGGTSSDYGNSVAETSDGGAVITGRFSATVDFGGGPLTSLGSEDIFVLKLAADGSHAWSKRFGSTAGSGADIGTGVSATSDGGALITGYFAGTVDFGGGPLTAGLFDIFALKLAGDGSHVWSRRFGGTDFDYGASVSATSDGGALITGRFNGTVDFGGGPLTSAGFTDIFALRLAADGSHVWSRRFGGTGFDYGNSVAEASDGGALLTGQFAGTVDFGGGPLASAGDSYDIFTLKLAADGSHVWSRRFGDTFTDNGYGVTATSDGGAVITGHFGGTVDFGGGPLTSAGSDDIFALKLAADGSHVASRPFGGTSSDVGTSVAATSDGGAVITGHFNGTVDFGGGPLTSAGSWDIYALRLVLLEEEASITAITDVPGDQGGWVRIAFAHSGLDDSFVANPIQSYYVWSRVGTTAAAAASEDWLADPREAPATLAFLGNARLGARILVPPGARLAGSFPPGTWEVVGSAPAIQQPQYLVRVPTTGDSTDGGIRWSVFLVTAHTASPSVWFAGAPDSGYSVDNLIPSAPAFLTAEIESGPAVRLEWAMVEDPDVRYYGVYRGPASDFVPSVTNRVGATIETFFVDESPQLSAYYKVAAVDFAGNIGIPASAFQDLTGVPKVAPGGLALAFAGPNPALEFTALWMVTPQRGRANLDVYGLDGRRVRGLFDGVAEAGAQRVTWNLADERRRRVPAATYVARLEFGGRVVTKKLIVVR